MCAYKKGLRKQTAQSIREERAALRRSFLQARGYTVSQPQNIVSGNDNEDYYIRNFGSVSDEELIQGMGVKRTPILDVLQKQRIARQNLTDAGQQVGTLRNQVLERISQAQTAPLDMRYDDAGDYPQRLPNEPRRNDYANAQTPEAYSTPADLNMDRDFGFGLNKGNSSPARRIEKPVAAAPRYTWRESDYATENSGVLRIYMDDLKREHNRLIDAYTVLSTTPDGMNDAQAQSKARSLLEQIRQISDEKKKLQAAIDKAKTQEWRGPKASEDVGKAAKENYSAAMRTDMYDAYGNLLPDVIAAQQQTGAIYDRAQALAATDKNEMADTRRAERIAWYERADSSPEYQRMINQGKRSDNSIVKYIVDPNERKFIQQSAEVMGAQESGFEKLLFLTDKQAKTLLYYAGTGDDTAFNNYYHDIEWELNEKYQAYLSKQTADRANRNKAAGIAGNIAGSFGSVGGWIETGVQGIKNWLNDDYERVDYNNEWFRGAHMVNDTTEGITRDMNPTAKFFTQVGLSIGQFASKLPFGPTASLVMMSSGAAGQTALDALERGATTEQALLESTISGITEYLTEKLPVERLFHLAGSRAARAAVKGGVSSTKNALRNAVKEIFKQAGIEGTEELISEYVNTIADIAIMGDRSAAEQYRAQLIAEGMTPQDAEAAMLKTFFISQPAAAAAGGAVSGFFTGSVATATGHRAQLKETGQTVKTVYGNDSIADLIQSGLESDQNTKSYQTAAKLKEKLDAGKRISDAEIGKLFNANIEAIDREVQINRFLDTDRNTARLNMGTENGMMESNDMGVQQDGGFQRYGETELGEEADRNIQGIWDRSGGRSELSVNRGGDSGLLWDQTQQSTNDAGAPRENGTGYGDLGINAQQDKRAEIDTRAKNISRFSETQESFLQKAENDKKTIKTVENILYSYVPATIQSQNAVETLNELQILGINGFIHEGELQANNGGKTLISNGGAETLRDGSVGIRNDIKTSPKEAAGHELYHVATRKGLNKQYKDIFINNLDFASQSFEAYYNEITENYLPKDYDFMEDPDAFYEEFMAVLSGEFHSGRFPKDRLDMIKDWPSVLKAWSEMRDSVKQNSTKAAGHDTAASSFGPHSVTGGTTENGSLVRRMQQAIPQIQDMPAVAEITGSELPTNGKVVDRLVSFVNSIGDKVNRPGFGDILFSRGRLKNSMIGHGTGTTKIETFAAVPEILRNGRQIDYQNNWKGRGYDTYTFAAPINYKGERVYVGVIVTRDAQDGRYYVHEVVDENGNLIYTIKEGAGVASDARATLSGTVDSVATPAPSNSNIPQNGNGVNQEDMQDRSEYSFGPHSVGAAESGGVRDINALINRYGALRKGEQPRARDVSLPKETPEGKTSRFVQNAAESANVSSETAEMLAQEVANGTFAYASKSDQAASEYAGQMLALKGYDQAKREFLSLFTSGKWFGKNEMALGERLIVEANKRGDFDGAVELIADVAAMGTELGQSVQALRMLKKFSPEGQLMALQRSVERMNAQLAAKKEKPVQIPDKNAQEILKAKGENLQSAVDKAIEAIAEQMPATWMDKLNAWRYLAMLGNPRTHIRNVVGNAVFVPARTASGVVQAGLEAMAKNRIVTERTAVLLTAKDKALKDFALQNFNANKDVVTGESKYSMENKIKQSRQVFDTKVLEWLRKANANALEAEDGWFLKNAYVTAMAKYMKANGWNPDTITPLQLQKAENYATNQAQKATYRDFSAVAQRLNQLENTNAFTKFVFNGVLPFKKTPVNILKRGVEYSPVGLVQGVTQLLVDLKQNKGNLTTTQHLEKVANGLTGTGIMLLGTLLASLGVISGGDDKEKSNREINYDSNLGEQEYAIKIGNHSYTIDWAAPVIMPFMVGVEVYNALSAEREDFDLNKMLNALSGVTDPIFNLSMMDGIQSAIKTFKDDGAGALDLVKNVATSYAGQYIPTVLGQIARTVDDTRRTTYAPSNSPITQPVEKFLRQSAGKIPGLSLFNEPYVDQWGNETRQEPQNIIARFLANTLSPGYVKSSKMTKVDEEVMRVFNEIGEQEILPTTAAKKVEYGGETYIMSAKEYTKYAKTLGSTRYKLIESLLGNKQYQKLDDSLKAEVIKTAYDYAQYTAKEEYLLSKDVPYSNSVYEKMKEAKKHFILPETYALIYVKTKDIESDKDEDGEPIAAGTKAEKNGKKSASLKKKEIIDETFPAASRKQKQVLYELFKVSKKLW